MTHEVTKEGEKFEVIGGKFPEPSEESIITAAAACAHFVVRR
jgi:hypothetical protein